MIIPPGFEHLTINPGPGPMLFSDVVARGMSGNYDGLKAARGAAYLEVEQEGRAAFIPNPAYRSVPRLQKAAPGVSGLDLEPGRPLYLAFLETRGADWRFLWEPERFQDHFPTLDDLFLFELPDSGSGN